MVACFRYPSVYFFLFVIISWIFFMIIVYILCYLCVMLPLHSDVYTKLIVKKHYFQPTLPLRWWWFSLNIYNNDVYIFQFLAQKYNGKMRLFGSLTSGISSVSLLFYSFNMNFYINPLAAVPDHIRVFIFLLAHQLSLFIIGKDKTWHQSAIFENS